MIASLLPLVLAQAAAAQSAGRTAADLRAPSEIVAAAPTTDWIAIPADDLLVMQLAPDAAGRPRRVTIQLIPAPYAQGWFANIRALTAAHWWDGTSINRVQDNYVAQWGDASEKKPLPAGLRTMRESDYAVLPDAGVMARWAGEDDRFRRRFAETAKGGDRRQVRSMLEGLTRADSYAVWTGAVRGWPLASDRATVWPVHCYGMVGVGRDLSPDTGTGAELYAVIGHAPRHLDRNIALVGRVIEGIEHLSGLPRGGEALGFYKTAAERTPIMRIRLAGELPAAERPRFEYLSTESVSFAAYADARANRHDAFFIRPAGGADICNIPVPVRRRAG